MAADAGCPVFGLPSVHLGRGCPDRTHVTDQLVDVLAIVGVNTVGGKLGYVPDVRLDAGSLEVGTKTPGLGSYTTECRGEPHA